MWFENQNCAMMGLQATAGKRKLDAVAASGCVASATPPKSPRTCIAASPISPTSSPNNNKAFVAAVVSAANPSSSNGSTGNTFTSTFSSPSSTSASQLPISTQSSATFTISPNSSFAPPSNTSSFTVSPNSSFTSLASTSSPQNVPLLRCTTPIITNAAPTMQSTNQIVSPLSSNGNLLPSSDDCIARLRAVAVPGETAANHWQNGSANANPGLTSSALATTLLSDDLDEDDLDDYDDFSDDDRCAGAPEIPYPTTMPRGYQPAQRYPDFQSYQQQRQAGNYYHTSEPPDRDVTSMNNYQAYQISNNHHRTTTNGMNRSSGGAYWMNAANYYSQSQQTIRCDENGKSYLELGSAIPHPLQMQPPAQIQQQQRPSPPIRCCDGRTRWCSHPCYRQRRLAVLNLSMCKLARYRQCSDPSLHRSVLICNTLRMIEREMEAEGNQMAAFQAQQQAHHVSHAPIPPHHVEPPTFVSPFADYSTNIQNRLTPVAEPSYEQNLRELSSSGRATPFPTQNMDTDSGIGDEDTSRTINWSSVLSLTSQTDLDPLNNNELYPSTVVEPSVPSDVDMSVVESAANASNDTSSGLSTTTMMTTSLSSSLSPILSQSQLMDEFLPSWNKTSCGVDENLRTEQFNSYSPGSRFPGEGEWDSFMQVLVGGS